MKTLADALSRKRYLMVAISFGAKLAMIVSGAAIIAVGFIVFIVTWVWWGRFTDSVLFFMLFFPIGLLLMLAALIFTTKPRAPKPRYPGYGPYPQPSQGGGQYPPSGEYAQGQYPPQSQQEYESQQAYRQMYDQAYQYAYQQGYTMGLQKLYEQMYQGQGQPYQQYQQYQQYQSYQPYQGYQPYQQYQSYQPYQGYPGYQPYQSYY
ncbi:hypothetical protein [[Eubacterium] cellulosolvens]